jgi:hypothetical protein
VTDVFDDKGDFRVERTGFDSEGSLPNGIVECRRVDEGCRPVAEVDSDEAGVGEDDGSEGGLGSVEFC